MDIGRVIRIEPAREIPLTPAPRQPEPRREPAQPRREPEKVPA
jgi:hypothetical protein